jgi:hypothetical protein
MDGRGMPADRKLSAMRIDGLATVSTAFFSDHVTLL